MNPGIIPRNESIPPDTMEVVGLFAQRFYMKYPELWKSWKQTWDRMCLKDLKRFLGDMMVYCSSYCSQSYVLDRYCNILLMSKYHANISQHLQELWYMHESWYTAYTSSGSQFSAWNHTMWSHLLRSLSGSTTFDWHDLNVFSRFLENLKNQKTSSHPKIHVPYLG